MQNTNSLQNINRITIFSYNIIRTLFAEYVVFNTNFGFIGPFDYQNEVVMECVFNFYRGTPQAHNAIKALMGLSSPMDESE